MENILCWCSDCQIGVWFSLRFFFQFWLGRQKWEHRGNNNDDSRENKNHYLFGRWSKKSPKVTFTPTSVSIRISSFNDCLSRRRVIQDVQTRVAQLRERKDSSHFSFLSKCFGFVNLVVLRTVLVLSPHDDQVVVVRYENDILEEGNFTIAYWYSTSYCTFNGALTAPSPRMILSTPHSGVWKVL